MLSAVVVSLFYNEIQTAGSVAIASVLSVSFGLPFLYFFRDYSKTISRKEGYLIVSLGWVIMSLSGALPYLVSGTIPNFTNAFFETISGYTTTGATILNDIEILPKGILFWRSLTHWIGGMGIIVLAIAVLPLLGIGGMQLFSAEAPGIKTDKLHPRITQTAKILWGIYIGYTALQTLLLWWAGMSFFDAINHSFSTLSSGGFSTKNLSLAYWNNQPIIQYITIVFMFLAGSNFILSYFLLKGNFRKIWADDEFRYYTRLILIITAIATTIVYISSDLFPVTDYQPQIWGRLEASFRHTLFQILSVITTTGFVTSDYTSWGEFLKISFFGMMFLGACTGSTSGGIKIVRHLLMLKNGFLEFKRALHPNAIIPTRLNKNSVTRNVMYNIMGFFVLYMVLFIIGALVFTLLGNDFETSLGGAASSLGNIGPGLGKLNPMMTFEALSAPSKWWSSFLMLVGRLELLTILILFSPYFWKKI